MLTVKFQFSPREKVITPFGDKGVVTCCSIDDDLRNRVFVQRSQHSQWFREDELTLAEPD